MTPELLTLTLVALLQIGQFCAYSLTSIQQVGVKKAASPRDNPINLTGTAGDEQPLRRADPVHHRRAGRHPLDPIHPLHRRLRLHLSDRPHRLYPRLCFWLGPVAQRDLGGGPDCHLADACGIPILTIRFPYRFHTLSIRPKSKEIPHVRI
jgi:hypothetical protein